MRQLKKHTYQCETCMRIFVVEKRDITIVKYCSKKCRTTGKSINMTGKNVGTRSNLIGQLNHKWKGDSVGYAALHAWVRKALGKPSICENCQDNKKGYYEWANISGLYLRDISDWARLCKLCHNLIDDIARKSSLKQRQVF